MWSNLQFPADLVTFLLKKPLNFNFISDFLVLFLVSCPLGFHLITTIIYYWFSWMGFFVFFKMTIKSQPCLKNSISKSLHKQKLKIGFKTLKPRSYIMLKRHKAFFCLEEERENVNMVFSTALSQTYTDLLQKYITTVSCEVYIHTCKNKLQSLPTGSVL